MKDQLLSGFEKLHARRVSVCLTVRAEISGPVQPYQNLFLRRLMSLLLTQPGSCHGVPAVKHDTVQWDVAVDKEAQSGIKGVLWDSDRVCYTCHVQLQRGGTEDAVSTCDFPRDVGLAENGTCSSLLSS